MTLAMVTNPIPTFMSHPSAQYHRTTTATVLTATLMVTMDIVDIVDTVDTTDLVAMADMALVVMVDTVATEDTDTADTDMANSTDTDTNTLTCPFLTWNPTLILTTLIIMMARPATFTPTQASVAFLVTLLQMSSSLRHHTQ